MEDKKKYVLEGLFVKFRRDSGGGRIYKMENYLPHIKSYNRKIKIKNILDDKTGEI